MRTGFQLTNKSASSEIESANQSSTYKPLDDYDKWRKKEIGLSQFFCLGLILQVIYGRGIQSAYSTYLFFLIYLYILLNVSHMACGKLQAGHLMAFFQHWLFTLP